MIKIRLMQGLWKSSMELTKGTTFEPVLNISPRPCRLQPSAPERASRKGFFRQVKGLATGKMSLLCLPQPQLSLFPLVVAVPGPFPCPHGDCMALAEVLVKTFKLAVMG